MLEMMEFASAVKDAIFIPKYARGSQANVFYMIATADAMGANYLHALRSCYLTPDGKIGFQWDLISACLFAKGFKIEWEETNATRAVVKITRPDTGQSHTETFGVIDAKTIQFYKPGENGAKGTWHSLADKFNWKSYPKNMCMARAGMNAARAIAPDVMGGIYLPDELEGLPPEEATPEPAPEDYTIGVTTNGPVTASSEDKQPPFETGTVTVNSGQAAPAEDKITTRKTRAAAKTATVNTDLPPAAAEPAKEEPPPPPVEEDKATTIKKAMTAAVAAYNAQSGDKTGTSAAGEFARGYLGLAKGERTPSNMLEWEPIVAPFVDAVTNNFAILKADAHQCGHDAKFGSPLTAKFTEWGWPADAQEVATAYYKSSFTGKPDGFLTWMQHIGLDKWTNADDLKAFFTAAEISKLAAVDMLDAVLLPVCAANGGTYADLLKLTVSMTKKPMADLTKDDFDAAAKIQVDSIVKANEKHLAEKASESTATAEAAPAREDQEGFPFGE